MEVLDAQFEKAKLCARIGDKAAAYAAYNTIAEKAKISTGKKIDAIMAKTRVALFHMDTPQASVADVFGISLGFSAAHQAAARWLVARLACFTVPSC